MANIEKLEDLKVWQQTKALAVSIYQLSNEKLNKDFGFRDQIRRSAVSIPSNIAEGFGREGNREFLQFLSISKGSLYELKTQLLIGMEIGYVTIEEYEKISLMIEEGSRMISGLMTYLKKSDLKGSKYNNEA